MKKAFLFIDMETRTLNVAFGGMVKAIKLSELKKNEYFFDQLYHQMDQVNMVVNHKELNKREFLDFMENMQVASAKTRPKRSFVEDEDEEELEDDLETSTLYRVNGGKKMRIEDLDLSLIDPFATVDLSLYSQKVIDSSNEIKNLINNGILVKTTHREISDMRLQHEQEIMLKRSGGRKSQSKEEVDGIIDRKSISRLDDGDDYDDDDDGDSYLVGSGGSGGGREQRTIDLDAKIGESLDTGEMVTAADIMDMFGGNDSIEKVLLGGGAAAGIRTTERRSERRGR